MPRSVFCQVDQREVEGLDFIPWPGELGKRVFAHIGKPAWQRWLTHQTMLINENRLSPLDPKHRAFLEDEMQKFLFGGGAEIWIRPAFAIYGQADFTSLKGDARDDAEGAMDDRLTSIFIGAKVKIGG